MRPLKIPRDQLLQRCANTFKRYGYHGTTMDMLSAACGLTKASFYHHYPNKEALLRDVLAWTHEGLAKHLFSIADDLSLSPVQRLEEMGRKAGRVFEADAIGCLMAVVAIDASYGKNELMVPIREFFAAWAKAFARLYQGLLDDEQAQARGRQLVADYEGAILLARIHDDMSYFKAVTQRALGELQGTHKG
ncbi:TetR/AcrR family transcriptional regulator [Pseudomonas sp. NPDC087612]|uniref:TetR/AcrR family transcriptional regulator n=1 Tax=unclassified Pseudomonas TaxID=196821 RepID=UPI0005EB41E9|nr:MULTISPECIES: TetR/AcrR family transcriptional regulator [unclassified Pseudomonas]KJK18932.1 TetR family transcriptional regulator [Pseudomonas sp. 2(2015)]QPG62559.1 TetR/AcrR family transcriptional regulator [Pseudomonas sp. BIGb0427]UVL54425.1 TetR/AcrR family transcriptional regulator [Pseudomonas sp. B21-035]UVM64904.1 TetR/AcrR family transcriptional regulator [Pseudomonas sp. B21-009]